MESAGLLVYLVMEQMNKMDNHRNYDVFSTDSYLNQIYILMLYQLIILNLLRPHLFIKRSHLDSWMEYIRIITAVDAATVGWSILVVFVCRKI